MSNNVVLGDLSLYNGDDALKFDGSSECRIGSALISDDPFPISFIAPEYDDAKYIVSKYSFGESKISWGILASSGSFSLRTSSDGMNTTSSAVDSLPTAGSTVRIEKTGTVVNWFVNGLPVASTGSATLTIFESDKDVLIGARYSSAGPYNPSGFYTGIVSNVLIGGFTYIANGQFGNATLVSTPSGADGIINGAQWWKKGIDQQFDTPAIYKAQLPVTPVEFQRVTYTDATPVYKTNDAFWVNYDQDWLVVVLQGVVSNSYLINEFINKGKGMEYTSGGPISVAGGDFNTKGGLIYVGTGGTVVVKDGGGNPITFENVQSGSYIIGDWAFVAQTGTTASDMVIIH